MRWTVHGERTLYDSEWLRLALVDVEIPGEGGRRFEHHVIRMPKPASGVVVHDVERGVLLLWRHRFITDTWGWEIPAGRAEAAETPRQAAEREVLEETGWRPGAMRELATYHPNSGMSDMTFHLFIADGAEHVGAPTDPSESERIEWISVPAVRDLVRSGEVLDGLSLTALSMALLFELPAQ
jgi:8-oxo-dGTP pyrophosphatase MutT (NUDIX family)